MKNNPMRKATILISGLAAAIFIFCPCFCSYAQTSSKEEESLYVAKKAFEDGFYDVSLGLLQRFLKDYPDSAKSAEANLLIGECFFHQSRYLDALNKFEELLNSPSAKNINDAVLYWMAEVHFKGNNFERSAGFYKRVIDEHPRSAYIPAAYYSLSWSLFQAHKFAEALGYFKTFEEKFPKESQTRDARLKIIECLYNLKDYAGLKDRGRYYIKEYSRDPVQLAYLNFYLAEADYYLNNFSEASEEYSKVIAGSRDEKVIALSKLSRAWSLLKLKKYKEAEDGFLEIKEEGLDKRSLDVLLLGKAILAFETNRVNESQKLYDNLIRSTSDPLVLMQAYLGKADALYNLAEYAQAVKVYREALEKVGTAEGIPGEVTDKLHYSLAWALLKQGEFKEAIAEFQRVVKTSEDKVVKVSALCQVGDAYQDSGDFEKAKQAYDTILRDYPDSFYGDYVQYQLGITMLKSSNYDGAILSFLSLKKNFPESKLMDDASYSLGLAYFQKQDYDSSRDAFAKFQDEFKDSSLKPQALYLMGTSLYNLGKFNEAIEAFRNAVRFCGQDMELAQKAEYEIADCYYRMGDEKQAMARFKALRSKYPDSRLTAEVMWWLGEYYYRHNDLILARRYFSSLIQDFPKSSLIPDAYYALASTYVEEEKFNEALEEYKKVLALSSSDIAGQAMVAIADIYVRQDKTPLAVVAYAAALEKYPNLKSLIFPKIADLYYKDRNFDEALSYYRKCLDVIPVRQMADIQLKIGETLEAQGKSEVAIEEYLKVAYLYPENSSLSVKALLRAAKIYEGKENYKEAVNIYRKITGMKVDEAKIAQERIDWIQANVK